jgi:hypothetical protein
MRKEATMKHLITILLCAFIAFSVGCTRYIKPEKFDVSPELIPEFSGDNPMMVLIPENAEKEYLVEYADPQRSGTAKVYVDLNLLYKNAKELIEKELSEHQVPLSPEATKYLKFSITKVQWEVWAGGFSIGSYLEFDVETGDGYKQHYKVQDQSAVDVSRAVGGTVSRAVEKIFQDPEILAYIQK